MHGQIIAAILSELRAASITPEAATQNMIAIFANPQYTITSLNLYNNNISSEEAKALAKALEDPNCTLTYLSLEQNNIGHEGAIALAEALEDPNCTLTSLDLAWNNIGNEGAIALAIALKTNSTLTYLDLSSNNIGNEGAIAIAKALETNSTLTSLYLLVNDIGPKGGKAIAEALQTNSTLTYLYLPSSNIDSDTQTILFEAVLACAQKEHLIEINGVFSEDQKQEIQDTYQSVITTKSYQRLAIATALLTADTPSNSISSLNLDVLDLIIQAHTNPSTTPSEEVLERFKNEQANTTDSLPSAADEKQAAIMSLAKQCLFNISLGLLTSAFTAHLLDLTFDTTTILSTPFAMSLAVGLVVTTLAFFVTSSCRPFCLTSPGNRQHKASKELDSETAHTALGDTSNLQATPNTADNAQLGSR